MNYELALRLKEAGFPQLGCGRMLLLDKPLPESDQTVTELSREKYCTTIIDYNKYGEDVYSPTLEELIEACRKIDPTFELMTGTTSGNIATNYWYAGLGKHPGERISGRIFNASGYTPTEAVANLWLALNQK